MKLLINGGCGFLGSNLATHAIEQGYDVTIFDNLSRLGSTSNLDYLKSIGKFKFVHGDTRNSNDVENVIKNKFDVIFQLAGQVAMTTSIENPRKDFEINAMGTFNVLDSIRKYSPEAIVVFSSTNKVYGDLEQFTYEEKEKRYQCVEYPNGFPETLTLDFHSPYGCSKGCADQYMLDYNRIFGLKTVVFRHSSMYGSRQFATYDQGWIGWFCQKAIEKKKNPTCKPFTISGNGKQVRDILHADDMKKLYFSAIEHIDTMCGKAYNIGGGVNQSMSLLELFDCLNELTDVKLEYTRLPVRESDQKVFIADIAKVYQDCGWVPQVSSRVGVEKMLGWILGESK